MTAAVRPHDLLRLACAQAPLTGDEPGWVGEALARTPWVVVRRATAPAGRLPVGVRGTGRHQRHAAEVAPSAVTRVAEPERLRPTPQPGPVPGPARTRALVVLHTIGPVLDRRGLVWGPVGSAGFELATGLPVTGPASDLDLIVRTADLPGPDWAADLLGEFTGAAVRVDCLIETPAGAVALAEIAAAADRLVLRTATGPRLVTPAAVRAGCAGAVGGSTR
ncbi:malonate decarboxylase holo-ACP synthase [Catellatospora sp. NPDC049133]|uniref:malonate decarboxylase holo-ACP synthase n=1 Tax=Catellatospora sp. NPDC049133 TaxID=3155499 RepID=UPI0033DC24D3